MSESVEVPVRDISVTRADYPNIEDEIYKLNRRIQERNRIQVPSVHEADLLYVAREGGKMIGLCDLRRLPRYDGVFDLSYRVDPDFQGSGVARQMIDSVVEDVCGRNDIRSLAVTVIPEESTHDFLISLGFRVDTMRRKEENREHWVLDLA